MKKLLILFFVVLGYSINAQTSIDTEEYQEKLFNDLESNDRNFQQQEYDKTKDYHTERSFNSDLKRKYSNRDFNYTETEPKQETRERSAPNINVGSGFSFLGSSLPFIILIVLAIIIILAILQRSNFANFRLKKYSSSDAEVLHSEEESIDEGDFEKLLQRAIRNKDYRLATRYYYLWLIQQLTNKNYIEYHKDKTNTEYLFELKDGQIRSSFSYLSYIYSYIWYGEFPVDQIKFASIEEKYKSFMKQLK